MLHRQLEKVLEDIDKHFSITRYKPLQLILNRGKVAKLFVSADHTKEFVTHYYGYKYFKLHTLDSYRFSKAPITLYYTLEINTSIHPYINPLHNIQVN
jgi:hypothetical protein